MTLDLFAEIVGWVGAALILGGYALLTAGKLGPKDVTYQAMNVFGALGFIVNSGWNGAIPSAVLNVVWAGIGIAAIAGIVRARKRASPAK